MENSAKYRGKYEGKKNQVRKVKYGGVWLIEPSRTSESRGSGTRQRLTSESRRVGMSTGVVPVVVNTAGAKRSYRG